VGNLARGAWSSYILQFLPPVLVIEGLGGGSEAKGRDGGWERAEFEERAVE
jgi:hypothetical protein